MVSIDWTVIGYDVVSMVITFVIISIIAFIALWILDIGTPKIQFTKIKEDPTAEAIASTGWIIFYSLAFAGSLIAPFSLDTFLIREVIWTFIIVLTAIMLTLLFIFISPGLRYFGNEGLNSIGKEPIPIAIFHSALCIFIGIMSYTALTA
jgi:uncharacterized membrane protein YjfL (UPF0719 family)